jgi:hypothetical protein
LIVGTFCPSLLRRNTAIASLRTASGFWKNRAPDIYSLHVDARRNHCALASRSDGSTSQSPGICGGPDTPRSLENEPLRKVVGYPVAVPPPQWLIPSAVPIPAAASSVSRAARQYFRFFNERQGYPDDDAPEIPIPSRCLHTPHRRSAPRWSTDHLVDLKPRIRCAKCACKGADVRPVATACKAPDAMSARCRDGSPYSCFGRWGSGKSRCACESRRNCSRL